MKEYTIAVIGGGPAGYYAAIYAAKLGASVILFEKDKVGGTCLNRGCIPTKTYLKTAEYIKHIKDAYDRGITVHFGNLGVDMEKVVENKERVVARLTGGVTALLRSNGVDVVKGEASLSGADTVVCNGEEYRAKNIILCGGSKAGRLSIEGAELDGVLDSDGILSLTALPSSLCIVGGGVIGCELATAFSLFGSRVTIVEAADRILPMFDEEVARVIASSLSSLGVELHTSSKVKAFVKKEKDLSVVTDGGNIDAQKILVSIGRTADLSCLGSMSGQIKTVKGKIDTDIYLRTSVPNIYACGDINGKLMLAHAAYKMARIAVDNCLGGSIPATFGDIPSCLYTIPEAAFVGLTEEQAKQKYGEVLIGKFDFSANGRALAAGEKVGFVKVIADKKYGELLGVHIVGGAATEMISEAVALMAAEITVDEAMRILVHAHPSFSEAFGEAIADVRGMSIHSINKHK